MSKAQPQQAYDALILGGGPAGCATAIGLRAAGVERVLIVDRQLALPFHVGESATPDIAALLAELGLECRLERMGHSPYHGNMSMWGDEQVRLDHFLLHGHGNGWHLDRAAFDDWLRREAFVRGVRLIRPSGIESVVPAEGGWLISVRGHGEIAARVLVDAAGRRSPLATRLGIRRHRCDNLMAIATHAPSCDGLTGLSLVESFAEGWWYATSLPDGRALVTLMTDIDIARTRDFGNPRIFTKAWRNTRLLMRHAPPPDEAVQLGKFAAHSGFLGRAAGMRWIAVGDALMGLDPLTSSGISGALNDARTAVPVILDQIDGNSDTARAYARRADATFKRYLAERQRHYALEQRWADRPFWSRRANSHSIPDEEFAFAVQRSENDFSHRA